MDDRPIDATNATDVTDVTDVTDATEPAKRSPHPKCTPKSPPPAAEAMREPFERGVPSDVLGSYTGTPVDGCMPEQDADDL